jgi:hypothetical protein
MSCLVQNTSFRREIAILPRVRPGRLLLGAVCATLVLTLGGRLARAQESDISLRFDCPVLDPANRAALEARARAELTSAPLRQGEVAIECRGDSATVAWQARGAPRHENTVRLPSDAASTVEVLLEALDALLFEKPAATTSSEPAAEPAATAPAPEAAPPPTSEQKAVPPVATVAPAPAATTPAQDTSAAASSSYSLALTLGGDSELWRGAIPGALGVHAGGRLQGPGAWSITLSGGVLWGIGSAQGLSSRTLRVVAGVDYLVVPHVRLGVGADGRLMTVDGDPSVAPASHDGATVGALVSARYSLSIGALDLSAGPHAEVLAYPLVAHLGNAEVFRVPTVMVGFVVDVDAHFDR